MISVEVTLTDSYRGSRPVNWTAPGGKERIFRDPHEASKVFVGENFGYRAHAIKIIFTGEHYLRRDEVRDLFGWSEDEIAEIAHRTDSKKTLFRHWAPDGAGTEYGDCDFSGIRNKVAKAESSLTLFPVEAFIPTDSWIQKVIDYMAERGTRSTLTREEIVGLNELETFTREQYQDD